MVYFILYIFHSVWSCMSNFYNDRWGVQEESRSTGYVYVMYHSTELSSLFLHESSNLDQETFPVSVISGWHHQPAFLYVLLFSHHIEWSYDYDHHWSKGFFHCHKFNKYKWSHQSFYFIGVLRWYLVFKSLNLSVYIKRNTLSINIKGNPNKIWK